MKKCFVVLFSFVLSTACSFQVGQRESATVDSAATANAVRQENKINRASANTENKNGETVKQSINPRGGQTIDGQIKADCLKNRRGDKVPDSKQTFVMDFEPFRDACFVTFHDAEYTNPPLGSEFHVYRDGKPIFEFPSQLNGSTCWVEAVSFVDLNEDELKDIIVAGMCGAKAGPYSENIVYANTGDGFRTNDDANYKLADFKRIKEIENFVRRNRQLFFK
ncbi:MAG TPA: hypothetical protein VEQ34_04800 [Pyrinomonadaceae bacterium]|nr:hypothetical protein [Pyrinomonadaceae bacterium]